MHDEINADEPHRCSLRPGAPFSLEQLGVFVGRDRELDELRHAVQAERSLTSVLGPPGIGKTRLTYELAASLDLDVTVLDLTALYTAHDIVGTLGAALDTLVDDTDDLVAPIEEMARLFETRRDPLLVLDNCEHVIELVAELITSLRRQSPRLRVLATSRVALDLDDEGALQLDPLAYPESDSKELSPDALIGFPAVALFLERGRQHFPAGLPPREQLTAIADLIAALEGNPLAIELCASRLGLLAPEQMLRQMEHQLELLRTRRELAGARWTSLEGAISWSWALLEGPTQSVLAGLSIFRGGCTLESATAVLSASLPLEGEGIEKIILGLEEKSLLRLLSQATGGPPRVVLLESIRHFAADRLAQSPYLQQAMTEHMQHYLDELGPERSAILIGGAGDGSDELRARLEHEKANLMAIHDRVIAGRLESKEAALRALLSLAPLYCTHGPFAGYLNKLDTAVRAASRQDRLTPLVHAGVAMARALIESRRGRFAPAVEQLEVALPLVHRVGDTWVEAYILIILGGMLPFVYRAAESPKRFKRAQKLVEKLDDDRLRAIFFKELASYTIWRAPNEAEKTLKKARWLFRISGDVVREAYTSSHLCTCLYICGDLDRAQRCGLEALKQLEALDDRRWATHVRLLLTLIEVEGGKFEDAEAIFVQCAATQRELGSSLLEALSLLALGELHLQMNRPALAEKELSRVLELTRPLEEKTATAWTLTSLAVAAAARDRIDEAETLLARAEENAGSFGEDALRQALELQRGHIELARARALALADDHGASWATVECARRRLESFGELQETVRNHVVTRHAARSLELALRQQITALQTQLIVDRRGRWFKVTSSSRETVETSLSRKKSMRRILSALVSARLDEPGRGIPLNELFGIGWPGDRSSPSSASNRVYVTLNRLRNAGLGEHLVCTDSGYMLDPELPLSVIPSGDVLH